MLFQRFDLESLDIDIYDGDLFHINKALDNDTMIFELEDENGNSVLSFGIGDIKFRFNGKQSQFLEVKNDSY